MGARVIERDFVDYADFKNWAIPQAEHEWIVRTLPMVGT